MTPGSPLHRSDCVIPLLAVTDRSANDWLPCTEERGLTSFFKTKPVGGANAGPNGGHTHPHKGLKGISVRTFEAIRGVIMAKQVVDILLTPVYLYNIVKSCLTFSKQTVHKQIDTSLDIATDVKEVGESTGTFVGGLEGLQAIPKAHATWLGPFALAMSIFSIAGMIKNIRACFKMRQLVKEIKLAVDCGKVNGELTIGSYRNVLDLFDKKTMEDDDFVTDYFNANDIKFTEALVKIEEEARMKLESEDQGVRKEGQEYVEKALKMLKGRLKTEIGHCAIAATASVISIIATAILFCSPLSPAGWVILGVSSAMDLARWGHHKYVEYRFAKSINLERTNLEWLMC